MLDQSRLLIRRNLKVTAHHRSHTQPISLGRPSKLLRGGGDISPRSRPRPSKPTSYGHSNRPSPIPKEPPRKRNKLHLAFVRATSLPCMQTIPRGCASPEVRSTQNTEPQSQRRVYRASLPLASRSPAPVRQRKGVVGKRADIALACRKGALGGKHGARHRQLPLKRSCALAFVQGNGGPAAMKNLSKSQGQAGPAARGGGTKYGATFGLACLVLYTLAMFGVRLYAQHIGFVGGLLTIGAMLVAAYLYEAPPKAKQARDLAAGRLGSLPRPSGARAGLPGKNRACSPLPPQRLRISRRGLPLSPQLR